MNNSSLVSLSEAVRRIESGKTYLVAAEESLLRRLPRGQWIGGTSPYFVTEKGPVRTEEAVFLTELPDFVTVVGARTVRAGDLDYLFTDVPANGWGVLILPSGTALLEEFALRAPRLPAYAQRPLVGWVAGAPLSGKEARSPWVVNGFTGEFSRDTGTVLYLNLPANRACEVSIVNPFEAGGGAELTFPETGFVQTEVLVGGRARPLVAYLKSEGIDLRNPLVASNGGASVNVSIEAIDEASGRVTFYAPVFKHVVYRAATPPRFGEDWRRQIPTSDQDVVISFNCILNFLRLQQEKVDANYIPAPATFGEIAYQTLNQTMVCVSIHRLDEQAA